MLFLLGCFRYHKGTDFQANHNMSYLEYLEHCVVLDTTKVQIFKQITTGGSTSAAAQRLFQIPQRYRFSSKSQQHLTMIRIMFVVLDTTKVQIFKQITTKHGMTSISLLLFQIPQRYRFSSKSQLNKQCNKNKSVVLDTTKVQIFKQITTC